MPRCSNSLLTAVRQTVLLALGLFMLPLPPPQKKTQILLKLEFYIFFFVEEI